MAIEFSRLKFQLLLNKTGKPEVLRVRTDTHTHTLSLSLRYIRCHETFVKVVLPIVPEPEPPAHVAAKSLEGDAHKGNSFKH